MGIISAVVGTPVAIVDDRISVTEKFRKRNQNPSIRKQSSLENQEYVVY